MTLVPGTRLGPYEILAALGEGGMGEVYRARDGTLHRDVALKILPDAFASDPDRLARFRREAQLLAALNHPNIAAIYGFDESTSVHALVLELVEGPTLANRIVQGRIPVDEALPIATQIAEALEAAHEQGIIHRDLKPANIKLRPDGTVKVLDFGLAKLSEGGGAGRASGVRGAGGVGGAGEHPLSFSPTITSPALMTGAGMILGTAAYMAPEQAKGREADKRSDVWAFGAVLYEMLTGKRAFDGEDLSDTLANVLKSQPDWNALPVDVPLRIRTLIQRCLAKDRRERIADMSVVLFVIAEARSAASVATETSGPSTILAMPPLWRRAVPWSVAGGLGVALAVVLTWWAPWRSIPAAAPMRFAIVPPAAQELPLANVGRQIAISPDGTHLVYVAGTGSANTLQTQLMVRALDRVEAEPLGGDTNPRSPFISPDSQSVGFFAGAELKKVAMSGGSPVSLCRINGATRGATWGPDNTIVFATSDPSTGLMRVPAGGGEPTVLTRPGTGQDDGDHFFPSFLPGGRTVLFTIMPLNSPDATIAQVAVLDVQTGEQKTLIRGARGAVYVNTGHLVFAVAGTLRAVRFDPVRLEVSGDPVPVVEGVSMQAPGSSRVPQFSISETGALVYVPVGRAALRSLVWVNRQGREESISAPPRAYYSLRLAPDGERVALDIRDQENDIWIWSFPGQTLSRLTFDPGNDNFPVWTPDGRGVVFNRAAGGLLRRNADGSGTEERLTTVPYTQFAMSFSPGGKDLIVTELKTSNDLALLTMDGKGQTVPLLDTPFTEGLGEISPDGRWLAYQSNESGQDEVYVRPFPGLNGGRWVVSTSGGTKPVWAHSGRELFFLDGTGALTTVAIRSMPTFSAGPPTKLFAAPYFSAVQGRSYDVSPDGQRFLFIKDNPGEASAASTQASMVVVLNWFEELKRLVPVN